jgi:transmembrane sensor
MEDKEIILLLEKYRNGMLTVEEKAILESWYLHESTYSKHEISDEALFRNLDLIAEQLPLKYKNRTIKLWPKIVAVAASVAAIVFGVWFFNSSQYLVFSSQSLSVQSANDIAPGKNRATLTLGDGRVIQLSEAKEGVVLSNASSFSYDDGSAIDDPASSDYKAVNAAGSWNTVSTPKGGTYKVSLPDGTQVWLNAESTIKFPNRVRNGKRLVQLVGEAYFEVSKNKALPFYVLSNNQRIEVLGTHFNVSVYPGDALATTTLLEGSITLNKTLLKPNQQAVLMGKGGLMISNVKASDAIAWKDGDFIFKQEPLENIMKKVARWYDVDVAYQSDVSKHRFDGMVSRSKNLSSVLKMIELTGKVHFKVEGRRILVID